MKILFSAVPFDHGRSGISVYMRNTLKALKDAGHEVTVVTEPEAVRAFADFPQIVAPGWTRRPVLSMLWHLFILPFKISRKRFDFFYLAAANRRAIAFRFVPTAAVVHDLAAHRVPGKYDGFRTLYQTKVLPFFIRRAEFPVAISEATAEDMTAFLKIPREKITVSWNGLPERMVKPAGTILRRYGLEPGGVSALHFPAGTSREKSAYAHRSLRKTAR